MHKQKPKPKASKHPGLIIAIDGPAGSGKSTAAKLLSEAEGYAHLNTGAMYRAVTYLALEGGIDTERQPERVAAISREMIFEYRLWPAPNVKENAQHFYVSPGSFKEPQDLTPVLFTAALTQRLKPVVNNEGVREALVSKMRKAARKVLADGAKGVVLEGRDIGTVVFPDAFIKFFLHADLEERARRRAGELRAKGEQHEVEGLKQQIAYRDHIDSTRTMGPLKQAPDAIDINTTKLPVLDVLVKLRDEIERRKKQQHL